MPPHGAPHQLQIRELVRVAPHLPVPGSLIGRVEDPTWSEHAAELEQPCRRGVGEVREHRRRMNEVDTRVRQGKWRNGPAVQHLERWTHVRVHPRDALIVHVAADERLRAPGFLSEVTHDAAGTTAEVQHGLAVERPVGGKVLQEVLAFEATCFEPGRARLARRRREVPDPTDQRVRRYREGLALGCGHAPRVFTARRRC